MEDFAGVDEPFGQLIEVAEIDGGTCGYALVNNLGLTRSRFAYVIDLYF